MSFVPLRVRSSFSFLWGTASPEALVARAAALGHRALALTDRDSVAGAVAFLEAARLHDVRALLGAEITGGEPLLLLARDREGYGSLCRVVSERRLEGERFDPLVSLADDAAGLHVVCGAPALAERLATAVPAERLWLEVAPPGRRSYSPRALRADARRLGIRLVAAGAVSFTAPDEHRVHRFLRAAATNELLARVPAAACAAPDEVLLPPARLARVFADVPEAVANNRALAADCDVELHRGTPVFPRAPLPAGLSAAEHLRGQCLEGLGRRGRAADLRTRERLEHELAVIDRLGFVEYFLIVADIVRAARSFGVPTVGRGSGASSVVAWTLGITNVDPIEYGLVFERFLHEKRADCPDLDIDLCWRARDRVIRHVYETYGAERVAMISTHVLFHPRSAFREVARAEGLAPRQVDRLSKALPSAWDDTPLAEWVRRRRGTRDPAFAEPRLASLLAVAQRLEGLPRHFGIHSGGIVIGDRPLTWYTALARAAKGLVVTQYEMRAIERVGLVKIDLLGNRALSTLREAVALARRTSPAHAGAPALDLEAIPDGDLATARLLSAGDTLGVFQIESPGMRNLLCQLRPRDLRGVIAALSLIRPGPAGSGMKDLYVLRANGRAEVSVKDPRLRGVLAENHGILLYEEDVMKVLACVAGVDLADADGVRRAIGKARSESDWSALERWFVARAVRGGARPDAARSIWADLARFGAYAFCKAHASGYGVLAYRSAFLKVHFPAEYAVAVLNNHQGMYPKRVHVEEARRRGVAFRGPCVARSERECALEEGAVRTGLAEVAGLSERSITSLVEARREHPFRTLVDLLRRTRLTRAEAEALVSCGACDVFGENRPQAMWRVAAGFAQESARRAQPPPALFDAERFRFASAAPPLPDYDLETKLAAECEVLGFPVSCHPLAPLAGELRRLGVTPAARLGSRTGAAVRVAGIPSARRRVPTAGGEDMLFLTLDDPSGLSECVLFPAVYRRFRRTARSPETLLVRGRVEDHLGALCVHATSVHVLAGVLGRRGPERRESSWDLARKSSLLVGGASGEASECARPSTMASS
jgi:DNA-directed DNA polymerase III PolC